MGFRANGYFRWCGRSCLEQNLTGYLQQVFGYLSACWPSPARQGVTADSLILSSPARGAGVVEIAARCPAGANRSNHLVAHLDGDACAKRQWVRRYRYRLRPFNEVVPWEVKRICRRRFIGIPFDLCAA